MNGLNSTEGPIIESKQIGASQDCWGCGCCYFFNPFKYFLQSAIGMFANKEVEQNGIEIYPHKQEVEENILKVRISGFGTSVFGKPQSNVFLNPNDIKPEQIAYFIGQLIEAKNANNDKKLEVREVFRQLRNDCDNNNMKIIVYSASAGSFFALSSFLRNNEGKQEFFQEVVAKLFPDVKEEEEKRELQKQLQKLMKTIVKGANLVNPPGFLFHGGLNFGRERQSLAVGERLLASEEYFINMIGEYLSGGFELSQSLICSHNDLPLFRDKKNAISSSVVDEAVFPFYYVAKFAETLKEEPFLLRDNQKISKFVYKVMQYGDVNNADQIEKYYDEIFKESSTANKNTVKTLATKYLEIRDDYLSAQSEFNKSRKEEEFNKSKSRKKEGEKGFFQKALATLFPNVEEEKQKLQKNENSRTIFQTKAKEILKKCNSLCNSPTPSSPTPSLFTQGYRITTTTESSTPAFLPL